MENTEKKVLLSVNDLHVKFRVRGRILTAIRGVSLDFYENESVAIVGESGSGKSVFTKTFAGMLEENGFISDGRIIFNDPEIAETYTKYGKLERSIVDFTYNKLNKYSSLEFGAEIYREILAMKAEYRAKFELSDEEDLAFTEKKEDLQYRLTELQNLKQTIDPSKEKERLAEVREQIADLEAQLKALETEKADLIKKHREQMKNDVAFKEAYEAKGAELAKKYTEIISTPATEEMMARNMILAKEIYLSVGRYGFAQRIKFIYKLLAAFKNAMRLGVDLNDENVKNDIFDTVVFRVRYIDETEEKLHGTCIINLAKVKYTKDWMQIRGRKIATVFQDPMTSLNPIITIGKQITSVILKHQNCSELEARQRALELMKKVGIPNAENRFDDYPFQYSGGMRQRIVIAIALSCQPKILICDEPTTALDVTIQAQILKLLKDLQKEFNYTIVFITHDLGVVANIADRVAVLYAGQVVEVGTVEEVFYDPRHPYTWALLSSLPQLADRNTKLYSITGTPPSLYNAIVGDAFAPRNPYCLKIDTLKEPPMFQISETHFAKTWLLDPRSPKIEKPEAIADIHQKLMDAFNI